MIDTKRPRRLRCGVEAGGDTRGSYQERKTVISLKGRDGSVPLVVPLVVTDGDGVTEIGSGRVWWEWGRGRWTGIVYGDAGDAEGTGVVCRSLPMEGPRAVRFL